MLLRNFRREHVADYMGYLPLIPLCVISLPETLDEVGDRTNAAPTHTVTYH